MKNIAFFLLILMLVCTKLAAQTPFIDSLRTTFDKIKVGKNKQAVMVLNEDKLTLYDKTGKALPDMYEEISLLNKGLYMIKKKGKYALMDTNFTILTGFLWDNIQTIEDEAPEYDGNIASLKNFVFRNFPFLKVQKGDLYGLIDGKGAIVLAEICSEIYCVKNLNGLICETKDKAGFLGNDGKWILPLQYAELINVHNYHNYSNKDYYVPPYLIATLNGKMGVFDENGKEIIPLKYDDISVDLSMKAFSVKEGGKVGYYNFKGECIVPVRFTNTIYAENGHFQTIEKDTFYLYDSSKLVFQTAKYAYVYYEKKGYLSVGVTDTSSSIKKEVLGYGNEYTPTGLNVSSCAPEPPANIKMGLMDLNGQITIPMIYDEIRFYSPYFVLVAKEYDWALFNAKGKQLTDFILNDIPYLEQDENSPYIKVISKMKMGIMDSSGNIIVPLAYHNLTYFSKDKWIFEDSLERKGIVSKGNQIIVPALYQSINIEKEYWKVINATQLNGLLDTTTGKVIIPCEYNLIFVQKNFIYTINQNSESKSLDIFNLEGKKITHAEEDKVPLIIPNRNMLVCYKNEKIGAINNMGKILIPFKYDKLKSDIVFYKSTGNIDTILYFIKNKQVAAIYNLNLKHFNAKDSILWVSQANELRNFNLGIKYETKEQQYGIVRASAPHTLEMLDDISHIEEYYAKSISYHHAQKGEKEGLLDNNWEWLIPLQDSLLIYAAWTDSVSIKDRDNYLFVTHLKNHIYGLYGIRERRFIFPPIYEKIQALNWSSSLFIVEKKGLYALVNAQNSFLLPYQKYPIIQLENNMLFIYKDKKHFQLADTTGKILFQTLFEQYEKADDLWILKYKGIPYYFNTEGNFITNKYEIIRQDKYYFPNHFIVTQDKNAKKKRFGLIGMNNKEIVPAIYDKVRMCDDDFVEVEQDRKVGLYNINGKLVVPILYDNISINKHFIFVTLNTKRGVYNLAGKMIIPVQYPFLGEYPTEAIKVMSDGKWGIMDTFGKQLIPFEYEALSEMSKGNVVAQKNGKCGLLSSGNKWILVPEYEGMEILRNGFLKIKKDCKYRLLNPQGKELQNMDYEEIETAYTRIYKNQQSIDSIQKGTEYLFCVYNEGKMGVIDSSGNFLFPCIYTAISLALDQKFILQKDSLYGVVQLDLQPFLPFEYENISAAPHKGFYVEKEGKTGIINQQGKLIIPIEFSSIYHDGRAFVGYKESEEQTYFFDKDGNEVEEANNADN